MRDEDSEQSFQPFLLLHLYCVSTCLWCIRSYGLYQSEAMEYGGKFTWSKKKKKKKTHVTLNDYQINIFI